MQTLRNPDQVRSLFLRDVGMAPRVRMIRQFLVGEGQDEISVIVVLYDRRAGPLAGDAPKEKPG